MEKNINSNGYDYVDLGLPSGTLWATMNVGAKKPTDYGLYFQWGDTIGYTNNQVGFREGQKRFIMDDYKWSVNGSDESFIKYTTKGETLDLEDDAANANMGGDWHMPTPAQINELIDNTTAIRTKLDDVSGIAFTSKKDASKSIFIPAAGFACDGSVYDMDGSTYYSEGVGNVWSSMISAECVNRGQGLEFDSSYANVRLGSRSCGFSIRGVIG